MEEIINKIEKKFKDNYLGSTANDEKIIIVINNNDRIETIELPLQNVTKDNIIKLINDELND